MNVLSLGRMAGAARRFLTENPTAPDISVRVVVPARNEADAIGPCVRALVGQATEVVVVDDHSSDATAARAAAAGAAVVCLADDPPPGWLGKPRAAAAGAKGATTEWLAFVDADVVLHRRALASMAAATEATSVSIVGGLRCRSASERLLLPELGLVLAAQGLAPDFASGQCFLVRRLAYEAVGGHSHPNVRESGIDDRDLARELGKHDARLAPSLLSTCMYEGFRDLRAGLVKNQAALHPNAAVHLLWLLGPVATRRPWMAMVVSAGGRWASGQNPLYGLAAPLARAGLAAIYIESRWRASRGDTVAWKGRPVTVTGHRQRKGTVESSR